MEKTAMLASSFKDEYTYAIDIQVSLASAAHYAKLLAVINAEMLKSLTELAESLPLIVDLRKQVAEKQKQVDDLLREAGGYGPAQKEEDKKEEETQEDEESYW